MKDHVGKMVKGIEYAPDTVRIKGEASVLNTINKVTVPAEVLDVSGATEDIKTTVDISSYLPGGVSLVLTSDAQIEVTVKIESMVEKSFEIPVSALTVENLPENHELSFLLDSLTVEIAGAESDMKKLSEDDIKGVIDASGLGNGEHNVEVTMLLDEKLYQTTSTINIPVSVRDENAKETEESTDETSREETSETVEKTSKKNQ